MNIFTNVFRIDQAAILKHGALLPLVEGDFLAPSTFFAAARLDVEQPFDGLALHQRRLDDLVHVGGFDLGVQDAVGQDGDQRAHLA